MVSQYSYRLGSLEVLASSSGTLYTVPAASFAIVRSIDMVQAASGTVSAAYVRVAGMAYLFGGNFATTNPYLPWRGRQVLNAGDQLIGQAGTVAVWFLVSGYQFPLG